MKPEAGQWWFANDGSGRCYIHGISSQGVPIYELNQEYVATSRNWEDWHHEPRCTGWDWVAPEQPQPADDSREFLAGLKGVEVINEDPDEWVILDPVKYAEHVPRVGIDEFTTGNGRWQVQRSGHVRNTVGYWKAEEGLEHRCRRRDLPKVEQVLNKPDRDLLLRMGEVEDSCRSISVGGMTEPRKCNGCGKPLLPENAWMEDGCPCNSPRGVNSPQPQKTRVRLWMRNEPKGRPSLFACDERPYPDSHKYVEIHHDSEGFYTID